MTILIWLLCFIIYTNPVQKISYENEVNFKKNLELSDAATINTLQIEKECLIDNQLDSSLVKITFKNLLINTTPSEEMNLLQIGNQNKTTILELINLPDVNTTENTTKNIILDDSKQLCIYIGDTPDDTLQAEQITTDNIYGNDSDTIIFQSNEGTILLGNSTSHVSLLGENIIFSSPLDTKELFSFNANISAKNLSCQTIRALEEIQIKTTLENFFIRGTDISIENVTNSSHTWICGSEENRIENCSFKNFSTLNSPTFHVTSSDEATELKLVIENMSTTTNPEPKTILALNDENFFSLVETTKDTINSNNFVCNKLSNELVTDSSIIFDTNLKNEIIFIMKKTIWNSEAISPKIDLNSFQNFTCNKFVTKNIIMSGSTIFSNLMVTNLTSSNQANNFFIEIKKLYVPESATFFASNAEFVINWTGPAPSEKYYRYLLLDQNTKKVQKSYYDTSTRMKNKTVKNKNQSNIEKIKPKIFCYKSDYCQDICPKTNKKKIHLGFIVEDFLEEKLEEVIIFQQKNKQPINYLESELAEILKEYFDKKLVFIEYLSLQELLTTMEKNVETIKEKINIYKGIQNETTTLLKEVKNL